jgi:hypothetical protein
VPGGAPVGLSDAAVVALGDASGVSTGLVPPGVGLRSLGEPLGSSGVGEAEAGAVDIGVGEPVGGCSAIGTAAPTTVSSAAAAQITWSRRRKLATMRRRSATMERDYRPGTTGGVGVTAREATSPELACCRRGTEGDGAARCIWIFAHSSRKADVVSRLRGGRPLTLVASPVIQTEFCPWTALALMTVRSTDWPARSGAAVRSLVDQ